MHITPIEEIMHEAEGIQLILESLIPEEGGILVDRYREVNSYLARTGKMLADAKYHLSGKEKNDRRVEQLLVDWLDRLNVTCTRQLESIRTLISKEKEEMKTFQNMGRELK